MIQVKTVFFKAKSPGLSGGGLVEANLGVVIEAIVAQTTHDYAHDKRQTKEDPASKGTRRCF